MKCRLSQNALRFRLSVSDAKALLKDAYISESIAFMNNVRLVFEIKALKDCKSAQVEFNHSQIEVQLPLTQAMTFLTSNEETLLLNWATPEGELSVSIEKDLPCEPCEAVSASVEHKAQSDGDRFKRGRFSV
jgi:hypothetical protein